MRTYFFLAGLFAGLLGPVMVQGQQTALFQEATAQSVVQERSVAFGLGVRFRGVFIPQSVFERFVEIAPSGISQPEIGIEGVRRRGNFETSLGLAWANLSADDGIWVDDFNDPDDNPSLIEFDGFSWVTFDVNAIWKHPLNPNLALRYGLGIGLGVLLGDILETDYLCPGNQFNLNSCLPNPDGNAVDKPLDLPPLVPLMNATLGLQYNPSNQVAINFDTGVQTMLFVGISVDFFFEPRTP